jgi:hypothetical protein
MEMPSALPPPVQIRFLSLYQPDMQALAESPIPFGRWNEESIAAHLPVVVSYPAKISQRLRVLKGYLTIGGWPRQVPKDAVETIQAIVEQMMPLTETEIVRGVRLMAAAAIRDDGSRAVSVRDEVLSIFLAAKMLAAARVLHACRLVGEPTLNWGAEFRGMARVYNERLIHGLSFVAREPYNWAGWADADLWIDELQYRYRLFVPICPDPKNEIKVKTLPPEDVRRLVIPQVLRSDLSGQLSFSTIRQLAFEPWATLTPRLYLRDEVFLDTETYSVHRDAQARITRIAADRIISRLQQTPRNKRWRQFIKMTTSLDSVSYDVENRVREKVPFD